MGIVIVLDYCCVCSVGIHSGPLYASDSDDDFMCETCAFIDELAREDDFDPGSIELPTTPPPGCLAAIQLRGLGLVRPCWRCGAPTTCLVGLYPVEPAYSYVGLFTTDNGYTMTLMKQLAEQNGQAALVAAVKQRWSKTTQSWQVTNGCRQCDALQGNFWVQEEALARVATDGVDGLDTLFIAHCPTPDWQSVVHSSNRAVIGI